MKHLRYYTLSAILMLIFGLQPMQAQFTREIPSQASQGITKTYVALAVAIDPLQTLIGYAPVSLQYAIDDVIKVDVGIGPTFKPIWSFASGLLIPEDADFKMGLGYDLSIKYYPDYYIYDDSYYFGLIFRSLHYSFSHVEEGFASNTTYEKDYRIRDIGLVYGYDFPLDTDRLILDFYVATMLRIKESSSVAINGTNGPLHNHSNETWGYSLGLGVKLGYLLY